MLASLFAGVAGLRNHQTRMNVIGNNVSNINTIGFKSARSIFQEALIQTLRGAGRPSSVSGGTNPVQLGLGMNIASIDNIFTQGGLEITGKITGPGNSREWFLCSLRRHSGILYSRRCVRI